MGKYIKSLKEQVMTNVFERKVKSIMKQLYEEKSLRH